MQDHPLLASAIVEILEEEPGFSVYAVARTGADAVLLATREPFRVALMDYRLPDMNGAEAANLIRTANPATAIVFHTADDTEEAVLEAISAGASAYLTSSATAEEILEAVRRAAQEEVLIPVAFSPRLSHASAAWRPRRSSTGGYWPSSRRVSSTFSGCSPMGMTLRPWRGDCRSRPIRSSGMSGM